ncbi:hypothetical protein FACS1894120_2240 [Clostridia bacterium]|nr:hypothetical protein FACS1894120_2240 [Clostridia bacterium]
MIHIKYEIINSPEDQSEAARDLLRRLCLEHFGMVKLPEIMKTDTGKPYFKTGKIAFSISHSEYGGRLYIAAAVTDTEANVGVDIQTDTPKLYRAKKKILTLREIADDVSPLTAFTVKEAYGKMTGEGIGFGMTKLSAEDIRRMYTVKEEKIENGYLAAVCGTGVS